MRIAFMGTPEFAVPALQRLLESKHEVCVVITQPDRPRGRGRKADPCPVKALAETRDSIAIVQPERIRKSDVAGLLRARRIDIAVVVAYGQILPKEILEAPRLGCINIHASLLPLWRGAAPIQRCILSGAEITGISIMQLDEGMDTGPVIAQQSVDVLPDDDAQSVSDMLSVLGADMMLRVLDEAEQAGRIESAPQDDALASDAPPVKKEEGRIDWSETTEEIMFRIRAMTPRPGAYTNLRSAELPEKEESDAQALEGHRLALLRAEPLWSNEAADLDKRGVSTNPGAVVYLLKGYGPVFRTGSGYLLVTRLKPAGKAEMDGAAYINGRGIAVGDWAG